MFVKYKELLLKQKKKKTSISGSFKRRIFSPIVSRILSWVFLKIKDELANIWQFLGCTVTQLINNSKTIQWMNSRNYIVIGDRYLLLQDLGLHVFPIFKYLSKYFAQNYRAQYGATMLVYLQGTPTWRPESSANIWNLLWPSRPLFTWTDQANI